VGQGPQPAGANDVIYIVERLRNWRGVHLAHYGQLFEAAADEIERLRQSDRLQPITIEVEQLRLAIRRLADQDATLSVCDGAVTVTMDATLTDEEREAIEVAAAAYACDHGERFAAILRSLLERLSTT